MKKLIVAALMVFMASACSARLVCDKVVSKYGTVEDRNCVFIKGDIAPYYGPTAHSGDIRRVEKHADGSVTVERYGRDGEAEEWRETSPGEWKRFQ